MGVDTTMQILDLLLLQREYAFCLGFVLIQFDVFLLQRTLGTVVFVLHRQDILVDRDLIFEEVIQLVHTFSLDKLFILQQLQLVLQEFYLFLQAANVLFFKHFLSRPAFKIGDSLLEVTPTSSLSSPLGVLSLNLAD